MLNDRDSMQNCLISRKWSIYNIHLWLYWNSSKQGSCTLIA